MAHLRAAGRVAIVIASFVSAVWAEDDADSQTASVAHFATEFDDEGLPGWAVWASGETLRRKSPPKVDDGKLYLLPSWFNSHSSAALEAQSDQLYAEIDITFE